MSRSRAYYQKNKESVLEQKKLYYIENRESILSYKKASYDSDKKKEYNRKYYEKKKESIKETSKRYRQNNKNKVNSINAANRAKRKQACPKWLTVEHKQQLKQIYENCPDGMQVDHIIPLSSNLVCGLHVPWNLQIIS